MENETKSLEGSMSTVQEAWMGETNSANSSDELVIVKECACSFD